MSKKILLPAVILLVFFLVQSSVVNSAGALGTPWPMYRHDTARTGVTTSDVPNTNSTLWTHGVSTIGLDVRTTPSVIDGKVICTVRNRAFAFDERTGLELWNYQATGWLTAASYADGRLFFGKSDSVGGVICLNVSTGIEIWTQDNSPYFVMSSPLVNKGIVYAGMTDNSTYAFDAVTGSYKWQYKTKGLIASSPAADGNSLFFGSDDKKLYALNTTGSMPVSLWNFTANGAIRSTPAVDQGRVFVGSDNRTLYALNETTGKLIWSWTATDTSATLRNGVAVADDIVYLTFDKSSKVYALHADVVSGNYTESSISAIRYWTKDFSADYGVSGFNEPVYANGKIVVTSTGGSPAVIYALGASSGNTLWKRIVNWWPAIGNPCVADGRVWFSAYWWDPGSFTLYCLGQPFPPTTYHYNVNAGGTSFDVTLVTNSTVTRLNTTVLETNRAIGFGVPGIGTTGMCNMTVPNSMLGGPYVVTVDGKAPWTYSTTVIDATHTALYFTYNASSKVAQIIGATAVPEFPVPIAILVWGMLTLTVVGIRKRRLIP